MSFFNETYNEALAVAPDKATRGKRVAFLEAFDIAFQTQTRGAAAFGIQEAMRNLDDEQRQAMKKAGLEDIPSLSTKADDPLRMLTDFGEDYLNVARFVEGGGTPEMKQRIDEYDAKIADIRKRYPTLSLMTAGEMWNTVRTKAQETERASELMRPDNFVAATGGFLGGLAGSLNPNTDPFNFASLPVGFGGKTIVGRVVAQGAGQAGIETVNQFMGVQEQRQLLGLSNGPIDAAMRVGGAFVGGALVQGAGEAIGIGVRKLWPSRPKIDPVPPKMAEPPRLALPPPSAFERYPPIQMPPGVPETVEVRGAKLAAMPETFEEYVHLVAPTSTTRVGKLRTKVDIGHVEQQLSDWGGPAPWAVPPKTDTSPIRAQTDFVDIPSVADIVRDGNVDRLAREVDPDVMQRYDSLADEKRALRLSLAEATQGRDAVAAANHEVDEIEAQIATLEHKAAKVGAMKAKKLRKQIDELKVNKNIVSERVGKEDTPYMSTIRQRLMEVDERMRDLAEPVSRAYTRARGKWAATEAEHADVVNMMREGRKDTRVGSVADETVAFLPRERTLEEIVPALQLRDQVEVKQDADAADILMAVIKKQADDLAEVIESSRAEIKKLLGDDGASEIKKGPPNARDAPKGFKFTSSEDDGTYSIAPEGVAKQYGIGFSETPEYVQILAAELPRELRGKGIAEQMYVGLIEYAFSRGKYVQSDTSVSKGAIKNYERLREKGYDVRQRSDAVRGDLADYPATSLVSTGNGPVFTVHPKSSTNTIRLPGREGLLHLDNDHIAVDGQEITVREFLQRQLDNDEDLQAVSSCSIV